MANRALANALQLALAGATGGFGGLVQARSREQRELEARKEQERQALRDTLAQQQFGLQQREYEARFGPEAIARAEREAEARRRFEAEQAAKELESRERVARITAGAASGREAAERQAREREQEAAGMAYLSANRNNPAVASALGAIISSNPAFARRPGLAAYQLYESEVAGRRLRAAEAQAGVEPGIPPAAQGATSSSGSVATRAAGAALTGLSQEERGRAWMQANPRRMDESNADYAARARAAIGG